MEAGTLQRRQRREIVRTWPDHVGCDRCDGGTVEHAGEIGYFRHQAAQRGVATSQIDECADGQSCEGEQPLETTLPQSRHRHQADDVDRREMRGKRGIRAIHVCQQDAAAGGKHGAPQGSGSASSCRCCPILCGGQILVHWNCRDPEPMVAGCSTCRCDDAGAGSPIAISSSSATAWLPRNGITAAALSVFGCAIGYSSSAVGISGIGIDLALARSLSWRRISA